MMSFKKLSYAALGVFTLLILTSCSGNVPFLNSEPEPERNVLTNNVGSNGKIVAVKIDDTSFSHPQEGLIDADVIFVTQVEAGLT